MMNRNLIALVITWMLSACGPSQTVEQKRTAIESQRRQVFADIVRHEGECKAVAIEFPDDQKILESCIDTHRFMVENAGRMIELFDMRLDELERTGK
jgi:hypothetical protein